MIIKIDQDHVPSTSTKYCPLSHHEKSSESIDCIHRGLTPHKNDSDNTDEECDQFMKGYN